ncbi:aldose 1-epimerase family protein [Pseudoprimorskyibacter insulae]|uniref:Aldose 1-epimerase n=1 Tax=Pseudoprimorskyibacter insulae TaxID=1695997 RepID=A0A2R8AXI9_9RHOB|nr:aldose 1-epimerase family protein [Pseudoprimorskyibacter insulae]SPF80708.1 hypothetical protein PRI8871_02519 [Pseudoprimorskyibacter insulae]
MINLTTLTSGAFTATVSDMGAELQSLSREDGRQYLWHGDAAWWGGRAPILFPIVGRAVEGRVAVNGQGGEMGQHGFARRSVFERVDQGPNFVLHRLTASEATRAAYPSDFVLSIRHTLDGATLTVSVTAENTGDQDMPYCVGFHPAFCWPLPGGEGQAHRVVLDNGAEPPLSVLEGGYLAEATKPSPFALGVLDLTHDLFANDALIFEGGTGDGLRYGVDGGPELAFRFDNTPNLGIWQKPGAPFLCIEPWHGLAPRAGHGPEIADRPFAMTLAPGASAQFGYSVSVLGD